MQYKETRGKIIFGDVVCTIMVPDYYDTDGIVLPHRPAYVVGVKDTNWDTMPNSMVKLRTLDNLVAVSCNGYEDVILDRYHYTGGTIYAEVKPSKLVSSIKVITSVLVIIGLAYLAAGFSYIARGVY